MEVWNMFHFFEILLSFVELLSLLFHVFWAIHYQVTIIQSLLFTAFMQVSIKDPDARGPVWVFVPPGKNPLRSFPRCKQAEVGVRKHVLTLHSEYKVNEMKLHRDSN